MMGFWENEWNLFKVDMSNVKEFLTQPIEITFMGKSDLMLKPSIEEIQEKAETTSFWKNELLLFKQDMSNVKEFLIQPVTLK